MYKTIIYQNIKASGGRLTKLRQALIEIMLKGDCLISSSKLLLCLKKAKLEPNRSTIYRELKFLVANNIIVKNIISGTSYYEISPSYRSFEISSLEACKEKNEAYNYKKNFASHNNSASHNQGSSHKDHHHHHLICLKCNKIIKVEMENQLAQEEKKLAKKTNFNIVNHSLDFYGYCQKCKA